MVEAVFIKFLGWNVEGLQWLRFFLILTDIFHPFL
jgi:hypothetical protein